MTGDAGDELLIRTYAGYNLGELVGSFWDDARGLAADGYEPVAQVYVDGSWTALDIVVAVATIPLVIGIFLTVRMLVSKPTGSIVVTYSRP